MLPVQRSNRRQLGLGPLGAAGIEAADGSRGWARDAAEGRALLAVLALIPLLLAFWIHFEVGGPRLTVAVDDAVETVAPLLAGAACLWAARRSEGPLRLGWQLLAA